MNSKELAAHYEARVFDSSEAASEAGFVLTATMAPRNVWNKASASSAILLRLRERRLKGEIAEVGLVIEPWSVTGCFLPMASDAEANA